VILKDANLFKKIKRLALSVLQKILAIRNAALAGLWQAG
jgi:hypothetical protein